MTSMACKTCGDPMERKLRLDDITLDWCPSCGTCRLIAPDLEDHQAWWTPLHKGLIQLKTMSGGG